MLKSQQELNFSQYTDLYDKLIPQDHLFRKINELIDFSFIREELTLSLFYWKCLISSSLSINKLDETTVRRIDGEFYCFLRSKNGSLATKVKLGKQA